MFKGILSFGLIVTIAWLVTFCSAALNPNKFGQEGNPSKLPDPRLSVSASGAFTTNNEPLMNVNISIDTGNLIYQIQGRKLVAKAFILVEVLNDYSHEVIQSKRYDIKIDKALSADMGFLGMYKLNKEFKVPSGKYSIRVSATDKRSGNRSVSSASASIPESNKSSPALTDIQMLGFNSEVKQYEPLNAYSLPSKFDTLRFIVQVSVPKNIKKPLQMNSKLIRFNSDTLPARSIGNANYAESNIQYKGVNFNQKETLQTINRKLLNRGNVTVEFKYPALRRGNYRFEVLLKKSPMGKKRGARRNFGMRSPNFPALKSPRDKAQTLVYLMKDKDYQKLLSIQHSDSLEKAVKEFWYNQIGNRSKAKEVREQYYDRVIIANNEFSNFKEGWKTDQGMIFVLFGNPWIIDKDFGETTWFYSYNRLDAEKKFTFNRTKVKSNAYPFSNFILQRKFEYNNVAYQQRRLWLSGQILDTQI